MEGIACETKHEDSARSASGEQVRAAAVWPTRLMEQYGGLESEKSTVNKSETE